MLCFPELLNGCVFSGAPADAGLEFNQPPGENQGNGADPSFDGNRTHGTKPLAVATRGNRRGLYLPDLPFQLYPEQTQNLSQGRRQFHKKTRGQSHATAPKQGNRTRETFIIISSTRGKTRRRQEREQEQGEGRRKKNSAQNRPDCEASSLTW